jgi:hypothetical protein
VPAAIVTAAAVTIIVIDYTAVDARTWLLVTIPAIELRAMKVFNLKSLLLA